MTLTPSDFPAFFRDVYRYEPFPWQTRLARQVLTTGRWPDLLNLPTGTGKTSVIAIAVFHLALEACGHHRRRAPMRMLFVIDRRIVVDAAFEQACILACALRQPPTKLVGDVADALTALSGVKGDPLDVVHLRGGVPQDRDWVRAPAQPLVIVSTVDQVGSRLLFRGYGVSSGMAPVHAGLVGSDALWFLDEVHLSKPLKDTLEAIRKGHPEPGQRPGTLAEQARLAPFGVVTLSATPGETGTNAFRLDEEDWHCPVLRKRLEASKLATLEAYEGEGVDAFVEHAMSLAGLGERAESQPKKGGEKKRSRSRAQLPDTTHLKQASRIAVIVNRVDLARRVFTKLRDAAEDRADVMLLTGRLRPLDRDRLMGRIQPLEASPERKNPPKPIILVATQTVEAGADLDVDALVTEIAPIDALRQRFGRLDRLGERGLSRAVILHPVGKPSKSDSRAPWSIIARIYGSSAYDTCQWLRELNGPIDFGIKAFEPIMQGLSSDRFQALASSRANAPSLLPEYVRLWSHTSPAPVATPEPSLFLHGPQTSADIQVVWRADVDFEDATQVNLSLQSCPPSALEAVSLPIWVFRNWLRSHAQWSQFSDVVESTPEESRPSEENLKNRFAIWNVETREWKCLSDAREIMPGTLVVVPASMGGYDQWGWNPSSREDVEDLGLEAHYLQRLRGTLRVTASSILNRLRREQPDLAQELAGEMWHSIQSWIQQQGDEATGRGACELLLSLDALPQMWQVLLLGMNARRTKLLFYDDENPERGFIITSGYKLRPGLLTIPSADTSGQGNDSITDLAESSWTGKKVSLARHLKGVTDHARQFAERAGLDASICELITLAAELHDVGKVDTRFQADLAGQSSLLLGMPRWDVSWSFTTVREPLAKSERNGWRLDFHTPRAVPKYFRHEALSVAFAEKDPRIAALSPDEKDLVLWLIGTHHGYGRPFFPPCLDDQSSMSLEYGGVTVRVGDAPLRLDQGWLELAERVTRRYGPWELARLEAVLRLADHCASEEEVREDDVDEAEQTSGRVSNEA